MRGNVKSPVCQSPSSHWFDCVIHKPTGRRPFPSSIIFSSTLLVSPSFSLFFCHTCSFSLTLSVVYTHVHTTTHAHIRKESNTDPQWKSIVKKLFSVLQLWNLSSCVSQVFTRYGKCYTFNAGDDGRPPLITTKGGMGNGLELMLDIQQDEYLPIWGETGEWGHHSLQSSAARSDYLSHSNNSVCVGGLCEC